MPPAFILSQDQTLHNRKFRPVIPIQVLHSLLTLLRVTLTSFQARPASPERTRTFHYAVHFPKSRFSTTPGFSGVKINMACLSSFAIRKSTFSGKKTLKRGATGPVVRCVYPAIVRIDTDLCCFLRPDFGCLLYYRNLPGCTTF